MLVRFLGDTNNSGWLNAVYTLTDMGPKVVVPHLIAALLEKRKPYHDDKGEWWADDVEGICGMLEIQAYMNGELTKEVLYM